MAPHGDHVDARLPWEAGVFNIPWSSISRADARAPSRAWQCERWRSAHRRAVRVRAEARVRRRCPSREEGSSRPGANEGDVRASCPSACLRMSGREQDWAGLCLRIRKRVRILAAPGRTDTGRIKHSASRFVRVPELLSRSVSPFVRASEKLSIGPRGVPPCRRPPALRVRYPSQMWETCKQIAGIDLTGPWVNTNKQT